MVELLVVSACLVGVNCKYNGGNNDNEKVKELLKYDDINSYIEALIAASYGKDARRDLSVLFQRFP